MALWAGDAHKTLYHSGQLGEKPGLEDTMERPNNSRITKYFASVDRIIPTHPKFSLGCFSSTPVLSAPDRSYLSVPLNRQTVVCEKGDEGFIKYP